MSFVNEKIDRPERIREFDQLNLPSLVTGQPLERWKWTVDRERGFYLIRLGGGFSDVPEFFALVVPGGVIRFEGNKEGRGEHAKRNIEIEWQISEVRIPRMLAQQATELLSIVRDALTAYGLVFDSDPVQSVKVSLPSPTFV